MMGLKMLTSCEKGNIPWRPGVVGFGLQKVNGMEVRRVDYLGALLTNAIMGFFVGTLLVYILDEILLATPHFNFLLTGVGLEPVIYRVSVRDPSLSPTPDPQKILLCFTSTHDGS